MRRFPADLLALAPPPPPCPMGCPVDRQRVSVEDRRARGRTPLWRWSCLTCCATYQRARHAGLTALPPRGVRSVRMTDVDVQALNRLAPRPPAAVTIPRPQQVAPPDEPTDAEVLAADGGWRRLASAHWRRVGRVAELSRPLPTRRAAEAARRVPTAKVRAVRVEAGRTVVTVACPPPCRPGRHDLPAVSGQAVADGLGPRRLPCGRTVYVPPEGAEVEA